MKLLCRVTFLFLLLTIPIAAQWRGTVKSPNGRLVVYVDASGPRPLYALSYDKKPVTDLSQARLKIRDMPDETKFLRMTESSVDRVETADVAIKRSKIRNQYNELKIEFTNRLTLEWRVFDNGAAYRWRSDIPRRIIVEEETAFVVLFQGNRIWFPEEDEGFYSHNERHYVVRRSENPDRKIASTPVLVESGGVKLWISEADLRDYPGMWLRNNEGSGLRAAFPNFPTKEQATSDRDVKVTERADYMAETDGKRTFPWRVLGIAEKDKDLIDNQLVWLLSEPSKGDYSWIKPGKVPWDWWNANNVYGVDFKSGVNTQTYKYYIDFAAKYGLEYLILDEGWSKPDDFFKINPDIDMPELLRYAKQKNVGIVLWCVWATLDKQFDAAFDQFEKWGVKGIKVDFMQRDDQKMVNFYERTAKEAAKRKMLVDFHGAYKPSGLYRTYPNVISNEGVKGLENAKWSKDITPEHDVTLPFIRMVAGPMDFTPGAMINAQPKEFQINFNRPMSQGTRCHQLAMYVVYESPLQMLADSPSNYLREPDAMEFLSKVPSVWTETKPLDGRVGEFVAVARKASNGDWYVGAMTNSQPREVTLDLSFIGTGKPGMAWLDGMNADKMASDYKKTALKIGPDGKLTMKLAPGGGGVVVFKALSKRIENEIRPGGKGPKTK